MSPSSSNNDSQLSGGNTTHQEMKTPYSVQRYLSVDSTVHERVSGVVGIEEGEHSRKEYYTQRAKKALDGFEKAWKDAK
ncbi:uncharacterized protein F4812DRAFT_42633 [Daldinia caldariorum]|uniref:uncharacterized protein n=1 Tax=Daldinia caldariorum TaxID=326644 RepID=UPI002007F45A|nr:uncharacterized protein F4812DRAFT_42633 [Daldinia caldariorum]KAI1473207.1 hypothetical protein F4812DRAFT_42633 [Daldinia caldariorum]